MDAQRGIARRMIVGLPPEGLDAPWERDFAAYTPAGVLLFRRDFASLDALRALTARLRALARPRRVFIAIDEEGGHVSQLGGHLLVPPNAALLARGADPGDIAWASRVTGERLRALGLDWVFAPVADVHSEPLNPVIGPRAFGRDPAQVTRSVGEALRGFREARVAACLKHFPGHGDTELDSHLALPVCRADAATLERRELAPFRAHPEAPAVMTAHVVYPALDPGEPATFSRAIVTGLLRERLGFAGLAVTDALEMKGASGTRAPAEAARAALEAGADLLLFAFHDDAVRRVRFELARALVDGDLDRATFDAARPRLAAFDAAHPEPQADELARPLAALTPPDWEARLEAIAARGVVAHGVPPAGTLGLPLRVTAPEFAYGPTFAEDLADAGLRLAGEGEAAIECVALASRKPLEARELERLRGLARRGPVALVGLMNDAFLDAVPEATLRVSASDATPLARRAAARAIAARLRPA
jgi:beta-N-acetylhexosaminidase